MRPPRNLLVCVNGEAEAVRALDTALMWKEEKDRLKLLHIVEMQVLVHAGDVDHTMRSL
jgi:hypothetical protein